jgi:uncharacterized protein YndB with AHSA1/START domain
MITDNLNSYKTTINASSEKVWAALTDSEIVKLYFFGANQQSSYKIGESITWDGEFKGQKFLDKGEILECEPSKTLSYSYLSFWSGKEDKPENYLLVKYKLSTIENATDLTITFSSYDEERAKDSKNNWAMIIDGLKKVVEQ